MADTMRLALWQFPESDLESWCELVGTPEVNDFAEYITLLAAVQADQERQGREVVRVKFTVAEMRSSLAERGLENIAGNRATITALKISSSGGR